MSREIQKIEEIPCGRCYPCFLGREHICENPREVSNQEIANKINEIIEAVNKLSEKPNE